MLEAAGLASVRQRRTLFSGLSFRLEAGELLRVAGANGSGKTSLLRILCGLLAPTEGEVRWQGEPIGALGEEYATRLVYLGHAAAVKDDLTAKENLEMACRICGIRKPVDEALALFSVPGDTLVKRLSQGQKRRAALARLALAESTALWLLDEPFNALDAKGVELLKSLIDAHLGRGGIAVYSTHQDPGIAAVRVLELA